MYLQKNFTVTMSLILSMMFGRSISVQQSKVGSHDLQHQLKIFLTALDTPIADVTINTVENSHSDLIFQQTRNSQFRKVNVKRQSPPQNQQQNQQHRNQQQNQQQNQQHRNQRKNQQQNQQHRNQQQFPQQQRNPQQGQRPPNNINPPPNFGAPFQMPPMPRIL
ncbi:hypothetical protein DFH28DRAFT_928213 [Melampsora americana]|nr:hypothetical protein DFH28DRAFT_928213 [Melampsora americana]